MKCSICGLITIIFLISSCAVYVTDTHVGGVADEYLPKFPVDGAVAVLHVVADNKENKIRLGKMGARPIYMYASQIVDQSVIVAKDILTRNNVAIDENAAKYLKISVVNATGKGFASKTIIITIRVQAGDNIEKEFVGSQAAANWFLNYGIESAITYATIKIFQDPDILAYLNK